MLTNSSRTLDYFKDKFTRRKSDARITDADVIDAYNDFNSLVDREKRKSSPQTEKKTTSSISFSSSYALSNISDLGTIGDGFRVYRNEVKLPNILDETFEGSSQEGYYIAFSGSLYLTPSTTTTDTLYIQYLPKAELVADGTSLSTVTFGHDRDLERAFDYWNEYNFYEAEGQYDLSDRARALALAEIEQYFLPSNRGMHYLS